jgi:RimJ/RimL family protein N-acetyltransferase
MPTNLFIGSLVRLAAQNPDTDPPVYARFSSDSQYLRFLDTDPAQPRPASFYRRMIEERLDRPNNFAFAVHTLADDKLIGFIGLWVWSWPSGNGGVGIGMADPDYRGKGYGTDAMRLGVRYAFNELGLERVTLQAVAHNARALRSYEKVGFELMGTEREVDLRDGQRHGVVTMAITRARWNNTLGDTLLPYIEAAA